MEAKQRQPLPGWCYFVDSVIFLEHGGVIHYRFPILAVILAGVLGLAYQLPIWCAKLAKKIPHDYGIRFLCIGCCAAVHAINWVLFAVN